MRHRGIVVEIAPKNKVIIMTPSGEFLKVPLRKHVQVGQEIRYTPRRERLSVWQLAAAAVLFLALVGSWPMISERLVPPQPAVPAFTITLDVDSSVELLVSADRKVVGVEGLNRSGRDLVIDLDVVGADLTAALKTIAARTGGREAVVTVAALEGSAAAITEKGEGMYTELEREVLAALRGAQLAQVRIWEVPRSFQTEAKLAGIAPGRYLAIQRPNAPVVPLRIETRLTMTDPPEVEETVSQLAEATVAQRVMEPLKPALTPTRWTRQAAETLPSSIYNVSFPIAAVKGEY